MSSYTKALDILVLSYAYTYTYVYRTCRIYIYTISSTVSSSSQVSCLLFAVYALVQPSSWGPGPVFLGPARSFDWSPTHMWSSLVASREQYRSRVSTRRPKYLFGSLLRFRARPTKHAPDGSRHDWNHEEKSSKSFVHCAGRWRALFSARGLTLASHSTSIRAFQPWGSK